MTDLLKIAIVLAIAFASTFVLMQTAGLLTEAGVRAWFEQLGHLHPAWIAALIVALLVLDLFVAVPTMTTILLAGYLLGPWLGGATSALGLLLLGTTGYTLGRRFGRLVLLKLFKDERRLVDVERAFARNDMLTLFVCQALPMLPELSCTIAGIAKMRIARFMLGYSVGVVPFALIVAYAGSVSSLANPGPAIYTVIVTSGVLLVCWTMFERKRNTGRAGSD